MDTIESPSADWRRRRLSQARASGQADRAQALHRHTRRRHAGDPALEMGPGRRRQPYVNPASHHIEMPTRLFESLTVVGRPPFDATRPTGAARLWTKVR